MILGAWFWRLYGPKMVTPFNLENISPASYDVGLGSNVIIYRYQGLDFPGLKARLVGDELLVKGPDGDHIHIPALFCRGDIFLGETMEYFKQPRGVSLSFYLKSSAARSFLEHLHAGWGEHGFHGRYTLEFKAEVKGYVRAGQPIGQMVAHPTLGLHSYRDKHRRHYQEQSGVTESKNHSLAWRPWWTEPELVKRWCMEYELPGAPDNCDGLSPHDLAYRSLKILDEHGWESNEDFEW